MFGFNTVSEGQECSDARTKLARLGFMMFVLSPQLLLFGYVTWVWSLPPEPISLWEQQAKAWWVWVSLFCLIVVGTITGYVLLELHTSSVRRRHANSVWQSIKGQLRMELKESEQILAVNFVNLPTPLHPLSNFVWSAAGEVVWDVTFPLILASSAALAIMGSILLNEDTLSLTWQTNLVAYWASGFFLSHFYGRRFEQILGIFGELSVLFVFATLLVLFGFITLFFLGKFLLPQVYATLALFIVFHVVLLIIRFGVLVKFPTTGLLIVTNQKVILLGRIWRRWLILQTIGQDAPVEISMQTRLIDALMRWRIGTYAFVTAVNLPEAMELRVLISSQFPHWRWTGDISLLSPIKRLKRDGFWKLALLLAFAMWSGWIFHRANLQILALLKVSPISEIDSARFYTNQAERQRLLQRAQMVLKLMPQEPLAHVIFADTCFVFGEWEKTAEEMKTFSQNYYWRFPKQLISEEEKRRAKVAKRYSAKDWRFDAMMALKFLELMTEKQKLKPLLVNRAFVWLQCSNNKGAPKAISDITDLLVTAATEKDFTLLQKAQKQLLQLPVWE